MREHNKNDSLFIGKFSIGKAVEKLEPTKLRDYQLDILKKTDIYDSGIVSIPTGTGKTFCQAAILAKDILNNKGFNIYVINAPRIILSYQLLLEVYKYLMSEKITSEYMLVHSGQNIDAEELENIRLLNEMSYIKTECSVSVDVIIESINRAKNLDIPVIFVSTYDSCENIQVAIDKTSSKQIRIVFNDEAHYLVQEQYHSSIKTLKSYRRYYFTATLINTSSDKGYGLNNKDVYGDIIYEMTPAEAIQKGLIIRPRIHLVTTKNVYDKNDFEKSLPNIIKDCFVNHEKQIKINPKLIITVNSLKQISYFIKSEVCKELMGSGILIYGAASNDPDKGDNKAFYTKNGVVLNKADFLKDLKTSGKNADVKMIVLHYDTLSEGIDIDGLTGMLPLRSLSKNKFLQNFGRISRVYEYDKKIIVTHGKDAINNLYAELNKKYAYIIIPEITDLDNDESSNLKDMISELRSFDFTHEDIISDRISGSEMEMVERGTEKKQKKTGELIEDIFHELEDEELMELENKRLKEELKNKKRLDLYK